MSTLGEILEQLSDSAQIHALLLEADNLSALSEFCSAADEQGGDPCDLAHTAVQAFLNKASDEDWVKLMGKMQGALSPAGTCLSEMISWSLARSGTCSCS
ncbi:MAG: hypothetical protein WAW96_21680 [Alphaproteobacteria bacterium]